MIQIRKFYEADGNSPYARHSPNHQPKDENALQALRDTAEKYYPYIKGVSHCLPNIKRKLFIEHISYWEAQKGSEWISVDDRLPKEHTDVLVYYNNGVTADCIEWSSFYNGTFESTKDVTHWMPLPQLP